MRISKRIVGTVGALALAGATMAATSGAANAATPATPWFGCHGFGCIGKDAHAQGCSKDATTVFAISTYDSWDRTRVTLRLRFSAGCASAWATVTDTGRPDRATFWIYDRGTHALEVSSTERAMFTRQWQTTDMVGVAETKAQACIEVHSAPVCTPFFGNVK
jgi:hypothetical protein